MTLLRTAALAAAILVCASTGTAAASSEQEAMFQDDNALVYGTPGTVASTLDELQALGVDRVRISVFWSVVAPEPDSEVKPAGFDGANPGAYPAGAWDRYDTVVRLARERGIAVNFDVTTPAPDWATGEPGRADLDDTQNPDAGEYGAFVRALGTRYRDVDHWSFMNEPNQPGWLTPQWVRANGRWVEAATRIYRGLVDAGWQALQDTGHGGDTILIGELAPKGLRTNRGETRAIDALRFIRRLYCLDDNLQVLRGAAADAQGCPAEAGSFPLQHPGLFRASGWAQHPYELIFRPSTRPTWKDWATTGNLGELQNLLRRIRARYAQPTPGGGVPIYLTEFGYQTRPPDRTGVTPAQQAAYLNEAEYIAYRNRWVIGLSQFLMTDDGPPVDRTFQTGLRFANGTRKPAYAAYRTPLYLPSPKVRRGGKLRVWGAARPAGAGAKVAVQFRRKGSKRWRTLTTLTAKGERGYVDGSVRVTASGSIRLRARGDTSRVAAFRISR